jgi:tRNA A-37 threonylcarbamoyl transferase component Bud32
MNLLDATCASKTLRSANSLAAGTEIPSCAVPGAAQGGRTIVRRDVGHFRWHVREDYAALFEEMPPALWNELGRSRSASLIKENDGRQVWKVQCRAGDVYAKLYTTDGLAARVKCWIRGPACLSEWRAASYAHDHGLPAVEPIAGGYRRSPWRGAQCVLLTASLPDAVPLNQYWTDLMAIADPVRRHRLAGRIIIAVADLIAAAHQSGFRHVDLHAGNLLVVDEADKVGNAEGPRVFFVDLHGVRIGRAVSDRAVIRNLAQLNQWFRRHACLTQRIRFLRRYICTHAASQNRSSFARKLGLDFRQLVAALDHRAQQHAQELYAQRDRRAMRTNKYFARVRIPGGWRGHVFLCAKHTVPGSRASTMVFNRRQWETWMRNPLDWLRPAQASHMLKDSHSATVCRHSLPIQPDPLPVVCKRSLARSLRRRLSLMLRESRNLRTWRRGYALINRDMPTARPLAVLERRRLGVLVDSIVITEALPDAHDLDAVIATELTRLASAQLRRAKDLVIDSLCDLIKRMDARGFIHKDFKASNVMIQWDTEFSTRPKLSLVDLDGLVVRRRAVNPPTPELYRAIARMNVSLDHCTAVTRTDRVRFLKQFLSGWGRDGADWKPLWRDIEARSNAKRRQHERHKAWKLRNYGRP